MSGTKAYLPAGWIPTNSLSFVAFVHPATGHEVMETIHGYRAYRPDGSSIPGTYRTIRLACKAAEEDMR